MSVEQQQQQQAGQGRMQQRDAAPAVIHATLPTHASTSLSQTLRHLLSLVVFTGDSVVASQTYGRYKIALGHDSKSWVDRDAFYPLLL